jgi:PTS system nitrogen regulatory IIA component
VALASLLPGVASGSGLSLADLTRPDLIFTDLPPGSREEVVRSLADHVAACGLVPDAAKLAEHIWERERLGSTGIGAGVAIPHCKLGGLRNGLVAVGRTGSGVDFAALDGEPVRLFFLVISPTESPAEHLRILAAISRWIRADGHTAAVLAAPDGAAIYRLLSEGS